MRKTIYIVSWTLFGAVALVAQFYIGKWATETEKDPNLAETVQFSAAKYPEIAARFTRQALEQHIEALSSIPSRLSGTEGGERAAEYVMGQFRALGVGEPQVQTFPVTVPVHARAELIAHNGAEAGGGTTSYRIYPLFPNGVCPAALPEEGLDTRLVYAGYGRLADVKGKDLEGATVVVETGAREQWLYLIDLGAEAVVFVEKERPTSALNNFLQTLSHQSVPRFWMTREDAAPLLERVQKSDIQATMYSDARWEQRLAKNIWVDIPGVSEAEHNVDEVVVFESYYDSSSFAPSLAPGQEQACGIATLIELGKLFRDYRFEKTVRLLATAGHFQALGGIRHYVWEMVGKYDSPMRDVSPQGHAAMFTLDLSSNSQRVGLFYGGHFFQQLANNLKPRVSDLGRRAGEYAVDIADALGVTPDLVFVDTINPVAGKDWPTYVPGWASFDHEAALLAGIPSLGFITTDDTRFYTATPVADAINFDNLAMQAKVLACMLPNAFNVEGRYVKRSLPRSICHIRGRVVSFDPRTSYLPDKPVPDALVMARRLGNGQPFANGVLQYPVLMANGEGVFDLVGMGTSEEVPLHMAQVAFEGFVLERGRITWAPDFGQLGKESYPLDITPVQKDMELMFVLFPCTTLEIYNLFDPRNYNYLTNLNVLEAASNSEPAMYGSTFLMPAWLSFIAPTATIYAQPGAILKITAGAGAASKRMFFLNVPEDVPEEDVVNIGEGFDVDETPAMHHTFLQSARDVWRLDQSRIDQFGEKGIENARVNSLHKMAGDALRNAERFLEERNYVEYFNEARRALSIETRAYPDVLGMANDVVRGLVFYLALLLPFAFTMERLFLTGRRIETRIAGITVFFLGMFFILRFTHPAFMIVLSPMVVLLGFVIAALSVVVISIVMGKLEQLVSKHKAATQGEHESGVQAVSGATLAVEMGIANMRRRKARTILTSITLIVLTFSVLSFVSVTAQVRLQRYEYSEGATPYEGLLLRTRNWAPFPFETYASLKNEYGDTCVLAPRRWYYGALFLNQSNIDVQHGQMIRPLRAMVGLTAEEQQLLDVQSALLGDGKWLSPETQGIEPPPEILLPYNMAAAFLEIEPASTEEGFTAAEKLEIANAFIGEKVSLLGQRFTVTGVYDYGKMNDLVDIDGEELSPYDPVQMEQKAQEQGAPDPEEIQRYIHHSFADVAITSERVLGNLGGDLRAIAILPRDPSFLEPLVESLVNRLDYVLFANLNGVPTLLSSRNATRIGDIWNLIILMLIAGLIVFNTMLGSVYERTKEIGTYTALGIAPSHIGRLFLVEAAVFAIIGVMMGYVVGQSISRLVYVVELPLFGALNLNYSSLAGVGACILVIAMTLASSYYPSRKATELGVPDIERRWKLPPTKEAQITLHLPFTVSPLEAQGLVAFLKEYLDSHVDVSVGHFYVENVEAGPQVSGNGGIGVRGQFWLTPFDLGVSQYTTFILQMIEGMDVYGVQVRIERLSGDASSWRRANSRFMTDMRSQFLMWRNLTPEARRSYVQRGEEFAEA